MRFFKVQCCLFAGFITSLLLSSMPGFAASREAEVREVLITSKVLDRDLPARIYLPPDYSRRHHYPVLYLFHGQLETQAMWQDMGLFSKASQLIKEGRILPLIIVTPFIDNSFGVNTQTELSRTDLSGYTVQYPKGRFEDYIHTELIHYTDRHFHTLRQRESRWVGGISMGGFAALHIAFRHTEQFAKVGGHSPAFPSPQWDWLYPDYKLVMERNPMMIAENKDLRSLKIYLDCGTEDEYGFHYPVKNLIELLKTKGVEVEGKLQPGKHNKAYWSDHIEDYLIFYAGTQP